MILHIWQYNISHKYFEWVKPVSCFLSNIENISIYCCATTTTKTTSLTGLMLITVCLSVRPSIHLSIFLPSHPFVHPFACLSLRPSINPPIFLPFHPFVHPSVYPSILISIRPSIYLSAHSFIHPSVCLSVHSACFVACVQCDIKNWNIIFSIALNYGHTPLC